MNQPGFQSSNQLELSSWHWHLYVTHGESFGPGSALPVLYPSSISPSRQSPFGTSGPSHALSFVTPGPDLMKNAKKFQIEMMQKFGFYVHAVSDPYAPNDVNMHTHGFEESWGHADFQICLPMDPQTAAGIFHSLADHIKGGKKFELGYYDGLVQDGYRVKFVNALESGRNVLRVILPQQNGVIDSGGMTIEPYANQYR